MQGDEQKTVDYNYESGCYDDAGRLLKFQYPSERKMQLDRASDPYERVVYYKDVTSGTTLIATYAYTGVSRVNTRTYEQGNGDRILTAGYDDFRRTNSFAWTGGGTGSVPSYTYDYDKDSNRTYEYNQTTYDVYTYDNLNQITDAYYSATNTSGGGAARHTNFDLDNVNNRNAVDDSINDNDATYTVNGLNQYSAITLGGTYSARSHDDAGNLTDDGVNDYEWDYADRLSSFDDGSTTTTYLYDAQGRRVLKTVGSAKTRYTYDGWQCIEEYAAPAAASGFIDAPTRAFVNGNNIDEALQYKFRVMTDPADVDAINTGAETVTVVGEYDEHSLIGHDLVLWDSDTGATIYNIDDNAEHANGKTVITVTSGTGLGDFTVANTDYVILYLPVAYFYHTNVQGNVVAITDESGNIKEEITYDVYGRLVTVEVNGTPLTQTNGLVTVSTYFSGSLTKNTRLFQGRDLDAESGLYYFRHRQYDPVHGRFLSRDPLGYIDSLCLYQFVNNNPINRIDPTGLYHKLTTWERHYADLTWRKEKGPNHNGIAYNPAEGKYYDMTLWYEYEWRTWELWKAERWYSGTSYGKQVQDVANSIGIATAGIIVVLAIDDGTIIGIADDPAIAVVAVVGGGITGGLSLFNVIADAISDSGEKPIDVIGKVKDQWEWRNLKWYGSIKEKADYKGDYDWTLSDDNQKFCFKPKGGPENVARSGVADGTGPVIKKE